MITDKQNNGIPSASRGRMQLVKPQQTMNSGKTQASSNPVSELYNPIQAKAQVQESTQQNQGAEIRRPVSPQMQEYKTTWYSSLDKAREAFNALSDDEQLALIREIADGTNRYSGIDANRMRENDNRVAAGQTPMASTTLGQPMASSTESYNYNPNEQAYNGYIPIKQATYVKPNDMIK